MEEGITTNGIYVKTSSRKIEVYTPKIEGVGMGVIKAIACKKKVLGPFEFGKCRMLAKIIITISTFMCFFI